MPPGSLSACHRLDPARLKQTKADDRGRLLGFAEPMESTWAAKTENGRVCHFGKGFIACPEKGWVSYSKAYRKRNHTVEPTSRCACCAEALQRVCPPLVHAR